MNDRQQVPIGRLIRSRRIYMGYNQRELAEMLDLSQSTYSFIESGKRHLKKPEIELLARILDVDANSLKPIDP